MKGAACCPRPRHSAGQKARQYPLVALPARAVRCAPRLREQRARRACRRAARAGRGREQGWRRPPAPGAPHLGGHGSPMVPGAGPGGPVPLRARTAELRGPAHRLPRSAPVETKVHLLSPVRAPLWSLSAFWPNDTGKQTNRETSVGTAMSENLKNCNGENLK